VKINLLFILYPVNLAKIPRLYIL